jgi:hypothetical protein
MPEETAANATAESTSAETKTAETSAETTQSNLLAQAADKTAETAKTEGAEEKTEAPKYDKDGFEIDAEGKQKLDAEGKPIPKPAETKAPAEYADFTVPEGTKMDEQTSVEFKGLAKELDLTQEQAQKLLDFGGEKLRAQVEAPYKLWAKTQADWQAEVKADPEIGGTKFEQSIKDAAQVFVPGESNPFVGSAEEAKALRDALNMTGAGNNPAMVKFFVKIGKLLAEPGSLTGGPVKESQKDLLAKMYPTMDEKKD